MRRRERMQNMSKKFDEIELSSLFQEEYKYALEKVNYSLESSDENIPAEISVKDELLTDVVNSSIKIHIIRSVYFNPKSVFSVEVGYVIELQINQEYKEIVKRNQEGIKRRLIEEGSYLIANTMSRISLLIAQVTASSGLQPLITPPEIDINEE